MRRVTLRAFLIKLTPGYTNGVSKITYLWEAQIDGKEDTGGEKQGWEPKCTP